MSLLLYCIMKAQDNQPLPGLRGVKGEPIFAVAGHGLRAVASRYGQDSIVDLPGLMAYQDVIGACHALSTVIPMRFGAVLADEHLVLTHLNTRRSVYEDLLEKLHGCVEMGIRILCPQPPDPDISASNLHKDPRSPGRSFLASRRAWYDREKKVATAQEELAGKCRKQFSELYTDCKVEHLPVLSLYFLISPDLVDDFRQAFDRFRSGAGEKLLLSGPWPPYNFAAGEDERI